MQAKFLWSTSLTADLDAGVLSVQAQPGRQETLLQFMSYGSVILTRVASVIFLGLVVLAILGFRPAGKAAHETAWTGRKKSGRTAPAQRRPSRRKRDRAALLPMDATVTFAAERRA